MILSWPVVVDNAARWANDGYPRAMIIESKNFWHGFKRFSNPRPGASAAARGDMRIAALPIANIRTKLPLPQRP